MNEPARKEAAKRGSEGMIGRIRIELGSAFSAKSRLQVRGLNGRAEKEKVSLTLDRDLIQALRMGTGPKRLSAAVNELLYRALDQANLRALVEEMESERGPAAQETYQQLLDEWFSDID